VTEAQREQGHDARPAFERLERVVIRAVADLEATDVASWERIYASLRPAGEATAKAD
jgi:hypothetical protein